MRVADLNIMAIKIGVVSRHRCTLAQMTRAPNGTPHSFRGHQSNVALHVETCANVGMTQFVWPSDG